MLLLEWNLLNRFCSFFLSTFFSHLFHIFFLIVFHHHFEIIRIIHSLISFNFRNNRKEKIIGNKNERSGLRRENWRNIIYRKEKRKAKIDWKNKMKRSRTRYCVLLREREKVQLKGCYKWIVPSFPISLSLPIIQKPKSNEVNVKKTNWVRGTETI